MVDAFLWMALQAVPSEKDAEAAVRDMRAAFAGATPENRVKAIRQALRTPHERVIKAVGDVFDSASEGETVRIGAAAALGELDHPSSVDVLLRALAVNGRRPAVVDAVLASLVKLQWQTACPPLESMVKQVATADVRAELPRFIEVLGALGSPSSVEPLQAVLRVLTAPGTKRPEWPEARELQRSVEGALRAITGAADIRRAEEWEPWWKQNRPILLPQAHKVYWIRKTRQRVELLSEERPPADAVLVWVRITPPPAPEAEG